MFKTVLDAFAILPYYRSLLRRESGVMRLQKFFIASVLCLGLAPWGTLCAQLAVHLKDGTVLLGKSTELSTVGRTAGRTRVDKDGNPIASAEFITLVEEADTVRFFVSRQQVAKKEDSIASLQATEKFKLQQTFRGREQFITQVGTPEEITGFNERGQRRITFKQEFPGTSRPAKLIHIIQGITEINPKYVKIAGLTHVWEFGLPTAAVPRDILDGLIRHAINPQNPDDRFAVARFYTQAEMFYEANRELEAMRQEFPQLLEAINKAALELRQYMARIAVVQIKSRRDAGQYQFAANFAKNFPTEDISGAILLQVRELQQQCEQEQQQVESARDLLGKLQAQLTKEQAEHVAPLRSLINEDLHPATLSRLNAFLTLAQADNLKADQKLALALSGWVTGPDVAVTQLSAAITLWEARFLILDYLRAESPAERATKYEELIRLEGIGPEQVERLLQHLPPILETPDTQTMQAIALEIPAATTEDAPVNYVAVLPPEYRAGREYPVIMALRPGGRNLEETAEWWAGTEKNPAPAARAGYIVLVPEYAAEQQRAYEGVYAAHHAVVATLRDASRRFHIASDRIFLAGHGMGGNAVFDIGFSHPDLFAGIISISGQCEKQARMYWPNSRNLPVYVVNGELDRNVLSVNASVLNEMMKERHPVIYAEFIGRGYEDFRTESPRLLEWMSRLRRVSAPKTFEMRTVRPTDNNFWGWTFWEFPKNFGQPLRTDRESVPAPLVMGMQMAPGANIVRLTGGAKQHRLWLSPKVVDFTKRLEVKLNGARKYYAIPQPDISAMLEDFRLRADRQHIAWAMLEF